MNKFSIVSFVYYDLHLLLTLGKLSVIQMSTLLVNDPSLLVNLSYNINVTLTKNYQPLFLKLLSKYLKCVLTYFLVNDICVQILAKRAKFYLIKKTNKMVLHILRQALAMYNNFFCFLSPTVNWFTMSYYLNTIVSVDGRARHIQNYFQNSQVVYQS